MTLKKWTTLMMMALTAATGAYAEEVEAPCEELCTEIETPKDNVVVADETTAAQIEEVAAEEDRGNEI